MKVLLNNRKAYFNYAITDELIAGISLSGQEVKSLKKASASLKGSYISIRDNEAFLVHAHITPYAYAGRLNESYNPERDRKLLLKKKEISRLIGKPKGTVIIPLEVLETNRGLVKLKIGLGQGKKKYDKRETIKKRELDRRIRRGEE